MHIFGLDKQKRDAKQEDVVMSKKGIADKVYLEISIITMRMERKLEKAVRDSLAV